MRPSRLEHGTRLPADVLRTIHQHGRIGGSTPWSTPDGEAFRAQEQRRDERLRRRDDYERSLIEMLGDVDLDDPESGRWVRRELARFDIET